MSDTRITVTGVDGRDYRITHEAEGPEGWYIEWKSDERGHKYVGHWLIGGAAALLAEVVALRARVAEAGRESALYQDAARGHMKQRDEARAAAERLRAERDRLRNSALNGYELSRYVAAIKWDGSPNEPDWMDGLRDRIEGLQAEWESIAAADAAPPAAAEPLMGVDGHYIRHPHRREPGKE
jgi:hypothetical protein